jgi:hypothetical protein
VGRVDAEAAYASLRRLTAAQRAAGVSAGVAVKQALIQDPAGNLVELIEPAAGYRQRT